MLIALLVRGFFFLTVVGWYSTSLWKMIDGYFKGQFQRYLEDEYQRNPKMREDVMRGYEDAGKPASPLTEKELDQVLRSCSEELGTCTVGEADRASTSEESGPSPANAFAAGAAAAGEEEEEEEEVIVTEVEKEVDGLEELLLPTFREESARERDAEPPDEADVTVLMDAIEQESGAEPIVYKEEVKPRQQEKPDRLHRENEQELQQQEREERREQQQSQQREQQLLLLLQKKNEQRYKSTKKRRLSGLPQIGAISEKAARKKSRHEPLTLTDEDFERASRKKYRYVDEEGNVVERGFSEFDDDEDDSWTSDGDEDEEEEREGMPITDLPYKPAVDIYDLDRLPEDEFCPLTLGEDPTCEETKPWP